MPKLNEVEKRRPDFVPGTPVVLADGQAWSLRRPRVWFIVDDGNASGWRACLELDDGDDYQSLLDALYGARAIYNDGADDGSVIIRSQLNLGRRLLLANYDLTPEEVGRILRYAYDSSANPEGCRIRDEVMAVAEGHGPKPSPDGTDASPMLSGE